MGDFYNLGPLTTVDSQLDFSSCSRIITNSSGAFWAQTCSNGQLYDNPRCWPTAYATPPLGPLAGFGYYSPGYSCPAGYTTACHSGALSAGGSSFAFQFAVDPASNVAGCCPRYVLMLSVMLPDMLTSFKVVTHALRIKTGGRHVLLYLDFRLRLQVRLVTGISLDMHSQSLLLSFGLP